MCLRQLKEFQKSSPHVLREENMLLAILVGEHYFLTLQISAQTHNSSINFVGFKNASGIICPKSIKLTVEIDKLKSSGYMNTTPPFPAT